MDATDRIVIALLMGGFVLLGLAMLGVSLRFGPKRGTWNQPAAALRRPGRVVMVSMYAFAAAHIVAGLILALQMPGGGGLAGLLVLTVMALIYILMAHSWTLAARVAHRRHDAGDDDATPRSSRSISA